MLFSDATAPDQIKRDLQDEKRRSQQARTARTAEATTIGEGGITVKGGTIAAQYPSGRDAAKFGPLELVSTGAPDGHGLLVQADDDGLGRDIFRAKYSANSRRLVVIGQNPEADASGAIDWFVADAVQIDLHSHGSELRIQSHHGGDVKILGGDNTTAPGNVEIYTYDGGDWTADIDGDIDFDANGTVLIQGDGTMQLLCDGQAALGGATGTFLQPESGAGVANVRMDTATGRITYVPSTARAKRDIQDLAIDVDTVLQLRPRTWLPGLGRRHCPEWVHANHTDPSQCCDGDTVEPPADAPREVGFVAEELDELGLGEFVEYDHEGLPASIRYDRLTAALVPLLQRQQTQLDALTEKLEQLAAHTAGQEPAPEAPPGEHSTDAEET